MCRPMAGSSSGWVSISAISLRTGAIFTATGSMSRPGSKPCPKPGGICVSRVVRDQVRDKLAVSFEDMGEQQVKNIARPERVHRIVLGEGAGPSEATAGGAVNPPLVLPDKPSIAVLRFQNMSGDPEQEYFADGRVEEIPVTDVLDRISERCQIMHAMGSYNSRTRLIVKLKGSLAVMRESNRRRRGGFLTSRRAPN